MVLPTLIFWLRPRPMIFQYMGGSQLTSHKPLYPSGATCTLSVALCNRHVRETCPFHLSFSSSLCTYFPFNKILILIVHPNLLYPPNLYGFFFFFLGLTWHDLDRLVIIPLLCHHWEIALPFSPLLSTSLTLPLNQNYEYTGNHTDAVCLAVICLAGSDCFAQGLC